MCIRDRINDLVGYARKVFYQLSDQIVIAEYIEDYEINLGGDSVKIYDKTMSGVVLSFDLLSQRGICEFDFVEPDGEGLVDADGEPLIDSDSDELVDAPT
jgi:hypothetical protein